MNSLNGFKLNDSTSFNSETERALEEPWTIFSRLSYQGKIRNGLAGSVGISKAVLLLTEGRVGPAFDSKVRDNLKLGSIDNANDWIRALKKASKDVIAFEKANGISLTQAAPEQYADLHCGRIYDMAHDPGSSS